MPNRRKPIGNLWLAFCEKWMQVDHEGKVKLAQEFGVTYDTAKHWVSEGQTDPAREPMEPEIIDDLLAMPLRTQLDFVAFDIETSNLRADFSVILCAVIKPFGGKPVIFRGDNYAEWGHHRANDEAITRDIVKELSRHAVVVTHYGGGFDIPFLRAKSTRYGLPNLPPMFHVDTYRIAKANFAVSSRRLKALGTYFELGNKTDVEGKLWMQAAYNGDTKALDAIVEHNIQDCVLLERLAQISFPYLRSIPRL